MRIINVGISYHHAPIDVREKMAFSQENVTHAMGALSEKPPILENVIFSTCNRTEVYAVVEDSEYGIQTIKQFLSDWFQTDLADITDYFTVLIEREAIRHLLKLATGLDSMVIGETQILGQVKDALSLAQETKTTGKLLNESFKRVITFAKRAHKDTSIGRQAVSVSYVAVELAKKTFDKMANKNALIVGSGEMGELSLKNLQGAGVSTVTVTNRTFERAEQLADRFQARAVPYDKLSQAMIEADIVITSTGSSDVIVTQEMLSGVMGKRDSSPLCLIDIAVPRDVDPQAGKLDNVYLYDVDDLERIAHENIAARKRTAEWIEGQLTTEVEAFYEWLGMQDAVPVIKALNDKSHAIQQKTMASIKRKIPDLTEREIDVLEKHTKSIANQLLEIPIEQAKTMSHSKEALTLMEEIFGLDPEEEACREQPLVSPEQSGDRIMRNTSKSIG